MVLGFVLIACKGVGRRMRRREEIGMEMTAVYTVEMVGFLVYMEVSA